MAFAVLGEAVGIGTVGWAGPDRLRAGQRHALAAVQGTVQEEVHSHKASVDGRAAACPAETVLS